jgi:hypothetical protein
MWSLGADWRDQEIGFVSLASYQKCFGLFGQNSSCAAKEMVLYGLSRQHNVLIL